MREIVGMVEGMLQEPRKESVSQADIRKAMKLGKATVSRRVEKATEAGYLKDLNDTKGKEARLVPGEWMPEDEPILPGVEELRNRSAVPTDRGGSSPLPLDADGTSVLEGV